MSGRYLTDLAAVLAGAGLPVIEVDGWQTRARGSGGYSSGRPSHVMVHHTASGPSSDGWPDVNYMTYNADAKPVANLYLNRGGTVWVMAAGATNTNGSGGPIDNVAADNMNASAIGIEAGNNGTGEPWPDPQQRAYVAMAQALCSAYGIVYVRSHAEWAPGRKIDPAGPSQWAPNGGTWNMAAFRQSVSSATPPEPEPVPPSALDFAEETSFVVTAPGQGVALVAFGGGGVEWSWIYTAEDQAAFSAAGIPTVTTTVDQFQALAAQADAPTRMREV